MDLNLVNYILKQLQQGYSIYEIKTYLQKLNYDTNYIQQSIDYIKQNYPSFLDFNTKAYVQSFLSKGYTAEQVRQYLYQNGFPPEEINAAFETPSTTPQIKHNIPLTTIAAILIIIAIGVSLFFFLKPFTQQKTLFDIETELLNTEVQPGTPLSFNVEVQNFGVNKAVDILLSVEILDENKKILMSMSKTMAVNIQSSKKFDIVIPETFLPGNYFLKVSSKYEDETAEATAPFTVIGKEIEITPDISELKNYTLEIDNETFNSLTYYEMTLKVRSIGSLNPQAVLELCKARTTFKEECIYELAQTVNDINLCKEIKKEFQQDQCFFYFLRQGSTDRTICELFRKEELKKSCRDIVYQNELAKGIGS